jgi:cell fate regulator YaaT (PSP1 superfamily)
MTETSHSYPYVYSVRFEGNKKAYSFGFNDSTLAVNDAVVVETSRGVELGTIVTLAHETANVNIPSELKPILRKASPTDISRHHSNADAAKEAIKVIEADIKKLKLSMTLVSADYTLDRSKIVVVYVADERVDFRDLLKELAGHLHCRIELRQIGPRDKAKVIGGIGTCGLETCCSRFKTDFDVISINMAKNQNSGPQHSEAFRSMR